MLPTCWISSSTPQSWLKHRCVRALIARTVQVECMECLPLGLAQRRAQSANCAVRNHWDQVVSSENSFQLLPSRSAGLFIFLQAEKGLGKRQSRDTEAVCLAKVWLSSQATSLPSYSCPARLQPPGISGKKEPMWTHTAQMNLEYLIQREQLEEVSSPFILVLQHLSLPASPVYRWGGGWKEWSPDRREDPPTLRVLRIAGT